MRAASLLLAASLFVGCGEPAAPGLTDPGAPATPAPTPTSGIAYDGRRTAKPATIEETPGVSSELRDDVLRHVAAAYTSTPDGCTAGDAVLRLGNAAVGSFTAPGRSETAYLVRGEPCGASGAEVDSLASLVIYDGEDFVVRFTGDEFLGQSIDNVLDMDRDGVNELIITYGGTGQGVTTLAARAYTAEAKRLVARDLSDDDVLEDACGTGDEGAEIVALSVSYRSVDKGQPIEFVTEKYVASCRTPTTFTRVS